jgi:hypothetical protein
VSRFVDSREGENACLLDLTVNNGVGCRNVGVASTVETGGIYFFGNDLSSKPVAALRNVSSCTETTAAAVDYLLVVCITGNHSNVNPLRNQLSHGFNGA